MAERLPHRIFDELANSIWRLGQLTMSSIMESAPIPSIVKGELTRDEICLEPEFRLQQPYPIRPRHIGLTVSYAEPYVRNKDFTVYDYGTIWLDTRTYKREYTKGVVLLDNSGSRIVPLLNDPAPGKHHRPGSVVWRDIRSNTNIESFGIGEANEYIRLANSFADMVYKDS